MTIPHAAPQPIPPGWYPLAAQPGLLGYWNGATWTGHTTPLPPQLPAPGAYAPAPTHRFGEPNPILAAMTSRERAEYRRRTPEAVVEARRGDNSLATRGWILGVVALVLAFVHVGGLITGVGAIAWGIAGMMRAHRYGFGMPASVSAIVLGVTASLIVIARVAAAVALA